MADHPILFKSEMVRAIMTCARCGTITIKIECPKCGSKERRKTQTRRVIKNMPETWHLGKGAFGGSNPHGNEEFIIYGDCGENVIHCQYYPGDLLWVRESWRAVEVTGIGLQYGVFDDEFEIEALGGQYPAPDDLRLLERQEWRWGRHPSIHMPKLICRLWLKVKSVWVERVQEISRENAIAEGISLDDHDITCMGDCANRHCDKIGGKTLCDVYHTDADCPETEAFGMLWDSINAKPKPRYRTVNGKKEITHYESYPWKNIHQTRRHRGKPWHVYGNPHVFATEFERYEQ